MKSKLVPFESMRRSQSTESKNILSTKLRFGQMVMIALGFGFGFGADVFVARLRATLTVAPTKAKVIMATPALRP